MKPRSDLKRIYDAAAIERSRLRTEAALEAARDAVQRAERAAAAADRAIQEARRAVREHQEAVERDIAARAAEDGAHG